MALGQRSDRGIAAVVPDRVRGPELLVRRWGDVLVEGLMAGLVSLAAEHAEERRDLPHGLFVHDGGLAFSAGSNE
jgi:hypothetical protein